MLERTGRREESCGGGTSRVESVVFAVGLYIIGTAKAVLDPTPGSRLMPCYDGRTSPHAAGRPRSYFQTALPKQRLPGV